MVRFLNGDANFFSFLHFLFFLNVNSQLELLLQLIMPNHMQLDFNDASLTVVKGLMLHMITLTKNTPIATTHTICVFRISCIKY